MSTPLKVLLVEDNLSDAELILHELRRSQFDLDWRRVDTESDFLAALDPSLDLILTDYRLPQFDGAQVLRLANELHLAAPVIIVSGTIGEDLAVEALQHGALDYLLKDRLGRLGTAVSNALEQRRLRDEKRAADQALHDSEERYRSFVQHTSEWIFMTDEQGLIVEWNQGAEDITGLERQAVMGKPLWAVQYQLVSDTHKDPETYERLKSTHLEALSTGTSPIMNRVVEAQFQRSDGSVRVAEQRLFPIRTANGVRLTGISRDITERKRAEEALKESSAQFRTLFEASPDAILLIDPHGHWPILDCNMAACQMNGYTRDELVGQSIDLLNLTPADLTERAEYIEQIRHSDVLRLETFHRRKDGTVFPVEVSTSMIALGGRDVMLGIDRDITARKQAETEREALFEVMQAAAQAEDLNSFLELMRQSIAKVVYAENFCVTLYNQTTGVFEEVYSIDQHDIGPFPPARLEKSISGYVARAGQPLRLTPGRFAELQADGEVELIGTDFAAWLGVPLKTAHGTIGVLAVQDYEQADRYTERDQNFLASIAAQVALVVERKQAAEALAASEARLRTLFAAMHDAVLVIDRAGVYREIAPTNPEPLYLPPLELLGKTLQEVFPAEQSAVFHTVIQQVLETKQIAQIEYELVVANRSAWFAASISPLNADNTLWVARDITERKHAEQAIQEEQQRTQTILETVTVPMIISRLSDSKVLYVNQALAQFRHMVVEEMIGSRTVDYFVNPDDRRKIVEVLQQQGFVVDFETQLIGSGGAPFWVLLSARTFKYQNDNCVLTTYVDITDRKLAEDALKESEQRYRRLVESSPDAIIVHVQGRVMFANQAALELVAAHQPADLIGQPAMSFVHPDYRAVVQDRFQQTAEGRENPTLEEKFIRLDGTIIDVEVTSIPFVYQGQVGTQVIIRDITDRKRLDVALRSKVATLQALAEIDREIIAANDSQGILDLVCRRAAELVQAPKSAIATAESAMDLKMAASYGLNDPAFFGVEFQRLWRPKSNQSSLWIEHQPIVLNSIPQVPAMMSNLAEIEGVQSLVIVPLVVGEKTVGALALLDTRPRDWTADELQILSMLAGQATIGLENARLFEETIQRAERLAMLNRIARAVSATLELDELLEIVYQEVAAAVEAEVFLAALYDDVTNELDFRIRVDQGVRSPTEHHPLRTGMSGLIVATKKPVLVRDFEREKDHLPPVSLWGSLQVPQSWLGVPLLLGDRVIGVLSVQSYQPNVYGDEDQRLLTTIANGVVVAVENAKLYAAQDRRAARLAEIVKLGVELANVRDESVILNTLVVRTAALAQSAACSVILLNAETNELTQAAHIGLPEDTPLGLPVPLSSWPYIRAMLDSGGPLIVSDMEREELSIRLALVRSDIRAFCAYPMLRPGQPIGYITLSYLVSYTPSSEEVATYQLLADRAAGAIENARLFETEREQRTLAEALTDTAAALNSTLNFDELLDQIMANASRVVPHDAASIMVVEAGIARVVRSRGQIERGAGEAIARLRFTVAEVDNLRRMTETKEAVVIPDTRAVPGWVPVPEMAWVASNVGVPILVEGQPVGFLSLDSAQLGFFTPTHARRLQTFADQVGLAIENARLYQTEREQRAMADALRDTAAALSGTLDVDEVLDRILQNIERVVASDIADVVLLEDNLTHIVRTHGYEQFGVPTAAVLAEHYPVDQLATLQHMLETGRPLLIDDVRTYPGWVLKPHFEWIRSYLGAPIRINAQVIGFIRLTSAEPDSFTPLHAEHLLAFADQAALSLQNARLLAETERRAEQFELLYDAGLSLNQLLESRQQFEALFSIVMKTLHADRVEFFRHDPARGQVHFELGIGYSDEQLQRNFQELNFASDDDTVVINRVSRQHAPLYLPDVQADPRWIALDPDIRSALWVPIEYGHEPLGILGVLAVRRNAFSPQDQRLLTLFANQAAVALENARLLTETKQRAQRYGQLYETARDLAYLRDVPTLLTTIVEQAQLLLDAASSFIYLYDNERRELELAAENYSRVPIGTRLRLGEGLVGHIAQTVQPLLIADYHTWPGRSPQVEDIPYSATIGVPMQFSGQLIGVLGVSEFDESARRYTEADMNLLALFANQASGALQSVQLFEAERDQRQRLDSLYRAAQVINSTLDTDAILDRLTDQAMRATHATHGSVLIAHRDLGYFERRSLRGYSDQLTLKARADQLSLESGMNGRALQSGEVIYAADVQQEPDYFPLIPQTRSEMTIPILQNGRAIGNLDLQSPEPDAFREADLIFLRALTDQVAVAVEKARLFEEVQQYAVELEDRVARRTQELTTANQRLTELDRLKDQFISMVSHEFRTPITTILSSAEMLDHYGSRWTEEHKREHLNRIESSVKDMTILLDDILTIGKVDANKVEFMPATMELVKFCRELVAEQQLSMGDERQLTLISPVESLDANMDTNLLRRILGNLLSNAVKYSPQGSVIEFELTCTAAEVVFRIRDHGIGIPVDDQAHLFETFHRASNARTIQGTGLGLAITKRSVDLHGGTIEVESEENVGTTVTVKLPLGMSLIDKEIQ